MIVLLKRPEKTLAEVRRDSRATRVTAIICIAVILFFAARFFHIWDRAKNLHVVVDSVGGLSFDQKSNGLSADIESDIGTVTDSLEGDGISDVLKPNTVIRPGHAVGIATGSKLNGFSDAEMDDYMKKLVELGVQWVRFDIEWGFVQYASKTDIDWRRYDRVVNALQKHNLQGVGIITYTPQWARKPDCRGGAHCPPADPYEFAEFASMVVNRYKSKGMRYWEIWNEQNSYDFWATKADCVAYTDLLKATYPAIKKADPTAFVITGGLAPIGTTDVNIDSLQFIQCMYAQGGKPYFDAIGYHPYTYPRLVTEGNDNAWQRMNMTTPSIRSIMLENGDGAKKIWLTEFGAPTGGPDPKWYMSEEKQAQMVTDTMTQYKKYDWAGPIFWYTYKDSGNTNATNENFFGFVRFDGSFKPAYHVMKELLSKKL
jgi:polysaccharide biosynthesis protein PslG